MKKLINPIIHLKSTEKYSIDDRNYNITNGFKPISFPEVRNVDNNINIYTNGTVVNLKTGNTYTPYPRSENNPYLCVGLPCYPTREDMRTTKPFYVHRLVAYEYCNPPIDYKDLVVNHINGDKHDNHANNLEWLTPAANNYHARNVLYDYLDEMQKTNSLPDFTDEIADFVCQKMSEGYSDTEIGVNFFRITEKNNAFYKRIGDIRHRKTWKHISRNYVFPESSKPHAYTKEEKESIKQFILEDEDKVKEERKKDSDIFEIMQGRPYDAGKDRKTPEYKAINSVRLALRKQGYNV